MFKLMRLLGVTVVTCLPALNAQTVGTGIYPFGSYDSKGFDTINLGNLNVHAEIPIVNKPGRGVPFTYTIAYDSTVWSNVNTSGNSYWTPVSPQFGFTGLSSGQITGYWTDTVTDFVCPTGTYYAGDTSYVVNGYAYHDPFGGTHPFNYSRNGCYSPELVSGNGQATDGSGYTYNAAIGAVFNATGQEIIVPFYENDIGVTQNIGSITDPNGNEITNNGNGTFTDTLGITALTIAGSGTASSPLSFNYPIAEQTDGATSTAATAYYKAYTVQTSFQCSGIAEYGPVAYDLVDHITLADGVSTYSFTYEATPGNPSNVTGRINQIILPGGGSIGYQYSGGCPGGINGDGTPVTLVRTTSDGSKTYGHDINASHYPVSNNTVSDENGNETDLTFIPGQSGLLYETSRKAWQGSASANQQLEASTVSYNISGGNTTALTAPITQTWTTQNWNGLDFMAIKSDYDASGNILESTPMVGNSTLESSSYTYYNGTSNLQTLQTTDASGNLVSSATYQYDQVTPKGTSGIPQHTTSQSSPGNLTSSSIWIGGSSYVNTTNAYYDTGALVSTTGPSGTTTFSYDPTQTFATKTTLPVPSSGVTNTTSAAFDSLSGIQLSASGANSGQTVTYSGYDRLLRLTNASTPDGGGSQVTYQPNQVSQIVKITSTESSDTETYLDGYGRTRRTSVSNGTNWYVTDTCYDPTGRVKWMSTPYLSTGGSNPSGNQCSASTATQYAYDALGRTTAITRPDGSSHSNTYVGRAVESVETGQSTVSKIVQRDLLGRIASVCELSSNSSMPGSGSPVSCPGDISGATGFVTSYSYNLANHQTTISQGAQTRIFQTDAIGRPTSVTEPEEAGPTTYSYSFGNPSSGVGQIVTRTRPSANVPANPVPSPIPTTTTTSTYDTVGRLLSKTYSDNSTPSQSFAYDLIQNSWQGGNMVGQLSSMTSVAPNGSPIHNRVFAYDIMGRVAETVECLPDWCSSTYNPNQNVTTWYIYNYASLLSAETYSTAGNASSTATLNFGYNNAGQLSSITGGQNDATLSPSLYSVTSIAPGGPTLAQYGNGLSAVTSYDIRNRPYLSTLCVGSTQAYCNGGSMSYGYELVSRGNQVVSTFDSALGEGFNISYDEFGRLSSETSNAGPNNSFSYTYDLYGNRWQQNLTAGSGPQPQLTFNSANNQAVQYQYDVAGNVINDGIHQYTYDAENNLIAVDNRATASFVYDIANDRVKVTTPQGVERYGFDIFGKRTTSWSSSGTLDLAQYYNAGTPLAYWLAADGNIHFEHQDYLGTERARTGATGTVEGTYSSFAFGDNFTVTGSDTNPTHFALLDHDLSASSGLEHAAFREYSSTAGRWMSPDPYSGSYKLSNPQSLNRYNYARNRPLIFNDPSGLDPCDANDGSCVNVTDTEEDCWECMEYGWYPNEPLSYEPAPPPPVVTAPQAPNNCPGCSKPNQTPRQCADEIANTWSLTQAVPSSVMKVPVLGGFLNGLLGNTVTNFTTFFSGSVANSYGTMLGAGPTMLPLPSNAPTGLQGPTGVLISAVATGAGEFVGASKALIDGGIYLEAYSYCKTGKY